MSIKASDAVWNYSKMTGGARLVMLAIANFADSNGMAWPGIERLAEMTGVTPRSVQRAIQQCEEAGELAVERNAGRGNTNVYRILLIEKGDASVTFNEEEKVTSVQEKVTPASEKVTSVTLKGDVGVTRSNIEPSKNRQENEKAHPTSAFWTIPPPLQVEYFIEAWAKWLKHVDEADLTFTETQAALKLAALEEAGPKLATNSVLVSMLKGWRNIHITDEDMGKRSFSSNGKGKHEIGLITDGEHTYKLVDGKPVRIDDARTH